MEVIDIVLLKVRQFRFTRKMPIRIVVFQHCELQDMCSMSAQHSPPRRVVLFPWPNKIYIYIYYTIRESPQNVVSGLNKIL